jgi:hypothetical protein
MNAMDVKTDLMLPEARLAVMVQPTPSPLPIGVTVMVDEQMVAVVSLEELRRAAVEVDQMEVAAHYRHRGREFFP